MAHLSQKLGELLSGLAAKWSVVTALSSFVVYMLGYLALRFQVTALGIGTDLELLDERYLFEGAKFLIYLVSTVPLAVLILLPLAGLLWLAVCTAPASRAHLWQWWTRPAAPHVTAIIVSVLMIQFVMRKCFAFDNLLLREQLPGPSWFAHMLTTSSDTPAQLYFTLLLGGIALPAGLALAPGSWQQASPTSRWLSVLLFFLLGVQVLLLPVNYGVLLAARAMPRMAPDPEAPIEHGASAWLIWEGKVGMTFLVHQPQGSPKLLTVPRDKVTRVEIVAYDALARLRTRVATPSPRPRAAERTLAETLADVTGLSYSSIRVRNSHLHEQVKGDVFIVPSSGGVAQRLTEQGDLHSPIFLPGDATLLALRRDRLLRMDLASGKLEEIGTLPGAVRLVGAHRKNTGVVYLAKTDARFSLQQFDFRSGESATLFRHPKHPEDEAIIGYLRGDDRTYGDVSVLVMEQNDPITRWADVFIQRGDEPEINLTEGKGVSSRQPALAHDRQHVAFVRVNDSR